MFHPLRGVGFVTDAVPFSLSFRRGRSLLLTAVGHAYHVYDTAQLRLIRVGPPMPSPVTVVALWGSMEYVAYGGTVVGLLCGQEQWRANHTELGEVIAMLPVQTHLLVTLASDRTLAVWEARKGVIDTMVTLHPDVTYTAACIALPHMNKVLLGTGTGNLQLWNFRTGKSLWVGGFSLDVSMTSLAVCPYTQDVAVLGFEDGTVIVASYGDGTELCRFRHADHAAVTGVSFSGPLLQLLVSGTAAGEVAVWDLTERSLRGVLTPNAQADSVDTPERAHTGACTHVRFLEHEPVVVTSGDDNALRMYVFDQGNKSGRLLRSRQGHWGQCTSAQFVDDLRILTTGTDHTVRMHHVFTDLFSVELSQGRLRRIAKKKNTNVKELRVTPACGAASCLPRKNDWASLVTVHEGSSQARTWRMDNLVMTKDTLEMSTPCTAVATSHCGNLCVVGGANGSLKVFLLQTGQEKCVLTSHPGPIQGVWVTANNVHVVAASRDGTISVSHIVEGSQQRVFKSNVRLGKGCAFHAEAQLLIIATDDNTIQVFDTSVDARTSVSVRSFAVHTAAITAVALDPSTSRYIVSASLDATLCVWDLVTGRLLGRYEFETPATSLGFDPEANFLISTHAGCRGVYVWTNMMRYGVKHDDAHHDAAGPPRLLFPTAVTGRHEAGYDSTRNPSKRAYAETEEDLEALFPENPADENPKNRALTLSSLPRTKVMSVPYLDAIHGQAKPIAPPKQFAAPFFIPSTKELKPSFIVPKLPQGIEAPSKPAPEGGSNGSPFLSRILHGRYDEALGYLEALPASAVALEVERLAVHTEESASRVTEEEEIQEDITNLRVALQFFTHHAIQQSHVDFVEALLKLFLLRHGPLLTLWGNHVGEEIKKLHLVHRVESAKMRTLQDATLALVRHMKPS